MSDGYCSKSYVYLSVRQGSSSFFRKGPGAELRNENWVMDGQTIRRVCDYDSIRPMLLLFGFCAILRKRLRAEVNFIVFF